MLKCVFDHKMLLFVTTGFFHEDRDVADEEEAHKLNRKFAAQLGEKGIRGGSVVAECLDPDNPDYYYYGTAAVRRE